MRVAVIGGGPSGLVTLKYLKTANEFLPGTEPIETRLFEANNDLGGAFKHRAYENAEVRQERRGQFSPKHADNNSLSLQGNSPRSLTFAARLIPRTSCQQRTTLVISRTTVESSVSYLLSSSTLLSQKLSAPKMVVMSFTT